MKYLMFHNENFMLFCFLKDFFTVLNEDPKNLRYHFFNYMYFYLII